MKLAPILEQYFSRNSWKPFDFQREAFACFQSGTDCLVQASTGTGKTLAGLLGPLSLASSLTSHAPLLIWVTPLKALVNDLYKNILPVVQECMLNISVELRTGDSSSSTKAKQKAKLPHILITTPESLCLLLTYAEVQQQLKGLRALVVDEWHELLGTKRGLLVEVAAARLRTLAPALVTTGLSATIENKEEALAVLAGATRQQKRPAKLIESKLKKALEVETLLPAEKKRFPWAGHLGLIMAPALAERLALAKTSLVFVNTRNQAENWYQSLLRQPQFRPEDIALHHGSIAKDERARVEEAIKIGSIKVVVCTSSLDLGVDFPPVDLVAQIGSPKGISRFLQRAGRSGHSPKEKARILCVPTNSFELLEFAAVRKAILEKVVDNRTPLRLNIDVLLQHLMTLGLGSPFTFEEVFTELRSTYAYAALSKSILQWALTFLVSGGPALQAYDDYQRLEVVDGRYLVRKKRTAMLHRMSVGTIVSDPMVVIQYARGRSVGSVEESFIARLASGDQFIFAGKSLELIQFRDMKAIVRNAKKKSRIVPKWLGSKMPLSTLLACELRDIVAQEDLSAYPEESHISPLRRLQARWSKVPKVTELLVETIRRNNNTQIYCYPFKGRRLNAAVAAIVSRRITETEKLSVGISYNDYGFELLINSDYEINAQKLKQFLSPHLALEDLLAGLNATELSRRQFREICRVAGLIFQGYPGAHKTLRQIQVSSGLLFDVFSKYDPENLLLRQSQDEVLSLQFDLDGLIQALSSLYEADLQVVQLERLSPFAFPLWAERLQSEVSSEKLSARVAKEAERLEKAAGRDRA